MSVQFVAVAVTASSALGAPVITQAGSQYGSPPVISIGTAPAGGTDATAVAITTSVNGVNSVKEILLTNAGAGYTTPPTVSIVSATEVIKGVGLTTYGVGAAATALVVTDSAGIGSVSITSSGDGYPTAPTLFFGTPTSGINTATGRVVVSTGNTITQVLISDAGLGYDSTTGVATVSSPPVITGIGTFKFNEVVTGGTSGATGRVRTWNASSNELELGSISGDFMTGETLTGGSSGATHVVRVVDTTNFDEGYGENDEFEIKPHSTVPDLTKREINV